MSNNNHDELMFKQKYLKYKHKYIELKEQQGGLFGSETTILLFNRAAYPTLMNAIERYKQFIINNDLETFDDNKTQNKKELKYNEVVIKNNDINGIPSMWKYTVGKGKIEPVFNIFMEFAGSSQKDKETIEKQKTYKKALDEARKKFIDLSTIDLSKNKIDGIHSWETYLSKINCDNLEIRGEKLMNHINNLLNGSTNQSNGRKEQYNKFIELYSHAISTNDVETDKTFRPIAITKAKNNNNPDELIIKNNNVESWAQLDNFILISNFKQAGTSLLSSDQNITFKINSINEIITNKNENKK